MERLATHFAAFLVCGTAAAASAFQDTTPRVTAPKDTAPQQTVTVRDLIARADGLRAQGRIEKSALVLYDALHQLESANGDGDEVDAELARSIRRSIDQADKLSATRAKVYGDAAKEWIERSEGFRSKKWHRAAAFFAVRAAALDPAQARRTIAAIRDTSENALVRAMANLEEHRAATRDLLARSEPVDPLTKRRAWDQNHFDNYGWEYKDGEYTAQVTTLGGHSVLVFLDPLSGECEVSVEVRRETGLGKAGLIFGCEGPQRTFRFETDLESAEIGNSYLLETNRDDVRALMSTRLRGLTKERNSGWMRHVIRFTKDAITFHVDDAIVLVAQPNLTTPKQIGLFIGSSVKPTRVYFRKLLVTPLGEKSPAEVPAPKPPIENDSGVLDLIAAKTMLGRGMEESGVLLLFSLLESNAQTSPLVLRERLANAAQEILASRVDDFEQHQQERQRLSVSLDYLVKEYRSAGWSEMARRVRLKQAMLAQ